MTKHQLLLQLDDTSDFANDTKLLSVCAKSWSISYSMYCTQTCLSGFLMTRRHRCQDKQWEWALPNSSTRQLELVDRSEAKVSPFSLKLFAFVYVCSFGPNIWSNVMEFYDVLYQRYYHLLYLSRYTSNVFLLIIKPEFESTFFSLSAKSHQLLYFWQKSFIKMSSLSSLLALVI